MKSIFITGGARGIGLATAQLFLRKGWRVGVYDLDAEALMQAKMELSHPDLHTFQGDILSEAQLKTALSKFTEPQAGNLDVLHNNAGILEVGEFDQQELKTHLERI